MNKKNLNTYAVEKKENELIETIYPYDNKIVSHVKEGTDSFRVVILKKLLESVNLIKDAEDIVTNDYIIRKIELTEEEKEKVMVDFEYFKSPVMDLPREIVLWDKAGSAVDYRFSGEEKQMSVIREKSTIELDVTKGMVRIYPMPQWGNAGGVYATKLTKDTERRTEIKLVLKYEDGESYAFSEFITVKLSELVYDYEGNSEYKKHLSKLKKLMDYSPAGKEELNYQQLYVALCYFNNKITTRIISSDKMSFEKSYELIVSKVYELANGNVGDSIFGDGYYILTKEELEEIASNAGYSVKELVALLRERGLLDTDNDKLSRNQKTVRRNGEVGKFYCILTSEKYNEQCNAKADMLSISEEDFEEFGKHFAKLIGTSKYKKEDKETKEKKRISKNTTLAW